MEDELAAPDRAHVNGASRQAIIDEATAAFRQHAGQDPAWGWVVPGRIEIFGKHTDYAGGRSLVAAAPRGFGLVAGPRADAIVRVVDARLRRVTEMAVSPDQPSFDGWQNYVATVVRRLTRDFPGAALGTEIALASDLPRAAGLSSSSALIVGLASALVERGRLANRPEWAEAIQTPLDLAGYLAAVESGAGFGPFPGASGVGTHGGSEDHTAILTARSEHLRAYRYAPVTAMGDVRVPDAWTIVVATSGVAAEKTGAARDQYNRASSLTRTLLGVWNEGRAEPAPTLAAALASAPDALDELLDAVNRGPSASPLVNRLRHFVREDARVPLALEAVRAADADALSALAAASQADADQLLGNQIEETSLLAHLAADCGAIAASSFGAGFGGSVWAVVATAEAASFERSWRAAYLGRAPGRLIESFPTRGASGLAMWPVC